MCSNIIYLSIGTFDTLIIQYIEILKCIRATYTRIWCLWKEWSIWRTVSNRLIIFLWGCVRINKLFVVFLIDYVFRVRGCDEFLFNAGVDIAIIKLVFLAFKASFLAYFLFIIEKLIIFTCCRCKLAGISFSIVSLISFTRLFNKHTFFKFSIISLFDFTQCTDSYTGILILIIELMFIACILNRGTSFQSSDIDLSPRTVRVWLIWRRSWVDLRFSLCFFACSVGNICWTCDICSVCWIGCVERNFSFILDFYWSCSVGGIRALCFVLLFCWGRWSWARWWGWGVDCNLWRWDSWVYFEERRSFYYLWLIGIVWSRSWSIGIIGSGHRIWIIGIIRSWGILRSWWGWVNFEKWWGVLDYWLSDVVLWFFRLRRRRIIGTRLRTGSCCVNFEKWWRIFNFGLNGARLCIAIGSWLTFIVGRIIAQIWLRRFVLI